MIWFDPSPVGLVIPAAVVSGDVLFLAVVEGSTRFRPASWQRSTIDVCCEFRCIEEHRCTPSHSSLSMVAPCCAARHSRTNAPDLRAVVGLCAFLCWFCAHTPFIACGIRRLLVGTSDLSLWFRKCCGVPFRCCVVCVSVHRYFFFLLCEFLCRQFARTHARRGETAATRVELFVL